MIVWHLFDSHLRQFIDHANHMGRQWNSFKTYKPDKGVRLKIKYPAKFFLCVGFLVCFALLDRLYHETVLSNISAFNLFTTVDTYSTLSCNTNNENKLKCLVHMQPQIPGINNCYTAHGNVNYSFCGRLRTSSTNR